MKMGGGVKFMGKTGLRNLLLVSTLIFLGGCEALFGQGGWFGDKEKPPLPGKRISVLQHQRSLVPDPLLESTEIVLPAPTPNKDWPQAGGYANHAMHHILVNDVVKRSWSRDIGDGSDDDVRLISSPIVAEGKVFAIDTQTVVSAYATNNGNRLWKRELTPESEDDDHMSGGLAYEKGRVFVTTGFAEVIALDAKTGKVIWRKPVNAPMRTAPTVRGGRVFAVTLDNRLVVLNAANGDILWTHEGIPESASLLGGGSPAVDRGVVVVPYSSGELVALKVENGRILWSDSLTSSRRTDQISTLSQIRGRPIIDRGVVFAMSNGGIMVAIDMRTGRRIWEKRIGGQEDPWVAGNYLFILTNDAEIAALSRKDGSIHWVRALPRFEDEKDKEDPIVWTGPILTSDRLIVAGSQGQAIAVSPYSGRILGTVEMPDGVSVPPIVAGGSIYFLTDDAELVAYR